MVTSEAQIPAAAKSALSLASKATHFADRVFAVGLMGLVAVGLRSIPTASSRS